MYLKQAMSSRVGLCSVAAVCSYSSWYCHVISHVECFVHLH